MIACGNATGKKTLGRLFSFEEAMKTFIVIMIILCAIPLQALFLWLMYRLMGEEKRLKLKAIFKKKEK